MVLTPESSVTVSGKASDRAWGWDWGWDCARATVAPHGKTSSAVSVRMRNSLASI